MGAVLRETQEGNTVGSTLDVSHALLDLLRSILRGRIFGLQSTVALDQKIKRFPDKGIQVSHQSSLIDCLFHRIRNMFNVSSEEFIIMNPHGHMPPVSKNRNQFI